MGWFGCWVACALLEWVRCGDGAGDGCGWAMAVAGGGVLWRRGEWAYVGSKYGVSASVTRSAWCVVV